MQKFFSSKQMEAVYGAVPENPNLQWTLPQACEFGRTQFPKNWSGSKVITFYTTKGGVLKTSLAFHVARTMALWGLRVCAVGLDLQGDLTRALGVNDGINEEMPLDQVLPLLDQMSGLGDVFFQRRSLHEVLTDTDMDNLKVIAESAELAAINDHLGQRNRREYWLKEKIVTPLSDQFDLIIFDCSPSWNLLATNALVSCDLLISPLECKITNFRNLPLFRALVDEFRRDLQLNFQQHFVPTRFRPQVRLSRDIKNWYEEHLPNVVTPAVKECALGEEAVATHQTMMEHAPSRQECLEMRQLIEKIYGALTNQSLGLGKATQIEFTEEHQKSHGESQWR